MKNLNHFFNNAIVFLCLITVLFSNCKTNQVHNKAPEAYPSIGFGDGSKVAFLDSTHAALAITTDDSDHFFDRVTMTEMEIQMQTLTQYEDRNKCLSDYIQFLQSDVENFTKEEIEKVSVVFKNIANMLKSVNPNLLKNDIILIKTKGNHYGNSVFYTRENKIVVPANELNAFNESQFTETMLHEFAHIFSRYNKEIRDQLYELIGFEESRGTIVLPENLVRRKLLNPDGTTDYFIKLETTSGEEVLAYPLISASEDHYTRSKPTFFNYLVFHLYELKPMEDNVYQLLIDKNGSTTIPFERIPSFFSKIKDNTNYIIHPDEIMADNFIYTVYYLAKGQKIKKFSKNGLELIEEIGRILQAH